MATNYMTGGFTNQLERGFTNGGGGPAFTNPQNYFGNTPGATYSRNSGPYYPEGGNSSELGLKPSKDAAFAPFFGNPTKDSVSDPYDAYDIENYQLPDGFKGSRPYINQIHHSTNAITGRRVSFP